MLTCEEPATAQTIASGFNEQRIERFFRKWLKLLPHPFPAADRKAGYRYQLSVLQAEFALTQVWDRPVHGREFFEQVSHDNRAGALAFDTLQKPVTNDEGQRASALRFGDRRVQALFAVLILLSLKIEGFRNQQLRPLLAQMLGLEEDQITQGKMTYDLRRLRLHGLIERIEKTHRYRLTRKGLGVAAIYQRTYSRLLRPALSVINGGVVSGASPEAKKLQRILSAIEIYIDNQAA